MGFRAALDAFRENPEGFRSDGFHGLGFVILTKKKSATSNSTENITLLPSFPVSFTDEALATLTNAGDVVAAFLAQLPQGLKDQLANEAGGPLDNKKVTVTASPAYVSGQRAPCRVGHGFQELKAGAEL